MEQFPGHAESCLRRSARRWDHGPWKVAAIGVLVCVLTACTTPSQRSSHPKSEQKGFDALLANLRAHRIQQNSPSDLAPSDIARVKTEIERCWNAPAGIDMTATRVNFKVTMNRDGTVRSTELLNPDPTQNAKFQAAADAAMTALHDPRCQPLSFPPDKYDKWKSFTITFDGSVFEKPSQ